MTVKTTGAEFKRFSPMQQKLQIRLTELQAATLSGNLAETRRALENYALAMGEVHTDLEAGKLFHAAAKKVLLSLPDAVRLDVYKNPY